MVIAAFSLLVSLATGAMAQGRMELPQCRTPSICPTFTVTNGLNVPGALTAGTISGNGAGITGITASSSTYAATAGSATYADSAASAYYSLYAGEFDATPGTCPAGQFAISQDTHGNFTCGTPAGGGSGVTIGTGTLMGGTTGSLSTTVNFDASAFTVDFNAATGETFVGSTGGGGGFTPVVAISSTASGQSTFITIGPTFIAASSVTIHTSAGVYLQVEIFVNAYNEGAGTTYIEWVFDGSDPTTNKAFNLVTSGAGFAFGSRTMVYGPLVEGDHTFYLNGETSGHTARVPYDDGQQQLLVLAHTIPAP